MRSGGNNINYPVTDQI